MFSSKTHFFTVVLSALETVVRTTVEATEREAHVIAHAAAAVASSSSASRVLAQGQTQTQPQGSGGGGGGGRHHSRRSTANSAVVVRGVGESMLSEAVRAWVRAVDVGE